MTSPPPERREAYGTVFESEVPLPSFRLTPAPADVAVRFGAVPHRLDGARATGRYWEATPGEALIETPGAARYHVAGGRDITVAPTSPAGRYDTFLLGVPMAACLMQRSLTVLHGAGVVIDGAAFVFAGPNGSGKSSLAAALVAGGAAHLADNLAAVDLGDGRPTVRPGPAAVRLWEDMALELGRDPQAGTRTRPGVAKYSFATDPAPNPVPLRAVVGLRRCGAAAPRLARLDTMAAAGEVARQHFRARLAGVTQPVMLDRAVALAGAVEVYRLCRPAAGWPPVRLGDWAREALG